MHEMNTCSLQWFDAYWLVTGDTSETQWPTERERGNSSYIYKIAHKQEYDSFYFLNPAASSTMASSLSTVTGAVLALSNFLSEEMSKKESLKVWHHTPVDRPPTKICLQGLQF